MLLCLSLSVLVLKHSKRSEIIVGEKEGDIRKEAAVVGEKLESGSMHTSIKGRQEWNTLIVCAPW